MEQIQILPIEVWIPDCDGPMHGFAVFHRQTCRIYQGASNLCMHAFRLSEAVFQERSQSVQVSFDEKTYFIGSRFFPQLCQAFRGAYAPALYSVHLQALLHQLEVQYDGMVLFSDGTISMHILIAEMRYELREHLLNVKYRNHFYKIAFQTEKDCRQVYYALKLVHVLRFSNELFFDNQAKANLECCTSQMQTKDLRGDRSLSQSLVMQNAANQFARAQSQDNSTSISLIAKLGELKGPRAAVQQYASTVLACSRAKNSTQLLEAPLEPLQDFRLQNQANGVADAVTPQILQQAIADLHAIIPARAFESGKRYKLVFSFVDGLVVFSVFSGLKVKYENELLEDIIILRQLDRKRLLIKFLPICSELEVDALYFRQFYQAFRVLKHSENAGIRVKETNSIELL